MIYKWVKHFTTAPYHWPHFVFVKHNIYILLHACSATVRLVHSLGGVGTWPDYLAICADQENEGPLGKKIARKSRNSCWVNGGGVDAYGQLTRGSNGLSPGTKYKRSKNVFSVTSIALSLGHIWARLLELPTQSLIGSPSTLILGRTNSWGKLLNVCNTLQRNYDGLDWKSTKSLKRSMRVLWDFRWFIRHLSSVVKSAAPKKSGYPHVPGSIPAKNTSTQIRMDLSK